MKAKVCVDVRMLFSSGIGTYLQNLIPRLEEAFALTLLIRKGMEKWVNEKTNSSFLILDAPIYTVQEQVIYPFKVPPSDLFWSPHYNVPLFSVLAKKRVVTIHDVCHLAAPQFFPKWKVYMASFLLKEAVRKSDLVLTVSEFSKKEILKFLPLAEKKIEVVTNGVKKGEAGFLKKEELEMDKPFVLYVGNNKPHKNVQRLLQAFIQLPSNYELILVSPEKSFPVINHPRVKYLFNVSEERLCLLYKKAKLLMLPSLYEGFGLTPLEAMSFGCPVVASFAASIPEVCGEAAYYVDPYDVRSIYLGMKKVLENSALSEQLVKAGYAREKEFSWDKTADRLIELFTCEVFS